MLKQHGLMTKVLTVLLGLFYLFAYLNRPTIVQYRTPLRKIQVACVLVTYFKRIEGLSASYEAWSHHCSRLFVVSSNMSLSLNLETKKRLRNVEFVENIQCDHYSCLTEKTFIGLHRAYEFLNESEGRYNEFDWILKADDDTYIHFYNLLLFLSKLDPNKKLATGFLFKTHWSGGAGYVLSRKALEAFTRAKDSLERTCLISKSIG
ncbi:hypothetical protein ACOME3_001846 [Neoechinorhynchus agilis]